LGKMFKKEVGQTPGEYRRTTSPNGRRFLPGSANGIAYPKL
jgi:AraC-like DNA-binding protein